MSDQDFVISKISTAFDYLDRDGDGVLTEADHHLMGRSVAEGMGYAPGSAEEQTVVDAYVRIWREVHVPMDADGDGQITKEEFVAATASLVGDEKRASSALGGLADRIMAIADRDGNGTIDLAEYTAFVRGQAPGLTPERVAEAFARMDLDGNGHLSGAELRQAVIEYFTSSDKDAPGNWYFG